jgi:hypothetical protein
MSIHWQTLERLRTVFLEGAGGDRDYWLNEADLACYDATFAQRIGWKWDCVLAELQARGWRPPAGTLLDWGCGSGIAARAFLDWFGPESVVSATFWDRSSMAMSFAAHKAGTKYPALAVRTGRAEHPGLVLLSHVLTELTPDGLAALTACVAGAMAVIWIEPGTWDASRRLIGVREGLRQLFHVVAPCTHGAVCGLLAPGNDRHWCHQFAPSPPAVFTDPFWGRFAQMTGVDLRSLPLSFLVLDRRPPPPLPPGTVRILGRPRIYKTHAAVHACCREGVAPWEIRRRELPEVYARWRRGEWRSLQVRGQDGDALPLAEELPRPA